MEVILYPAIWNPEADVVSEFPAIKGAGKFILFGATVKGTGNRITLGLTSVQFQQFRAIVNAVDIDKVLNGD